VLGSIFEKDYPQIPSTTDAEPELTMAELAARIHELEREMFDQASKMEFERAAELRDRIRALREREPSAPSAG
jgi:excinuclease ABC subunit B